MSAGHRPTPYRRRHLGRPGAKGETGCTAAAQAVFAVAYVPHDNRILITRDSAILRFLDQQLKGS